MIQQLHLAAQYLAAAGISFLDKKEDDSHTNLGFSVDKGRLETWPLNTSGVMLCLNYSDFALEWGPNSELKMSLNGKGHDEIVAWVSTSAKELGFQQPYRYDLHYTLPYPLESNFKFQLSSHNQITELLRLRKLAQEAIASFLGQEKLVSDIRIWPHHFDTGAFSALNDGSGKSVGLGMAIPDTLVNDLYFYISGYRGHSGLNTWAFNKLTNGKWINDGFKGAVLEASKANEETVVQFLQEALANYKG